MRVYLEATKYGIQKVSREDTHGILYNPIDFLSLLREGEKDICCAIDDTEEIYGIIEKEYEIR